MEKKLLIFGCLIGIIIALFSIGITIFPSSVNADNSMSPKNLHV